MIFKDQGPSSGTVQFPFDEEGILHKIDEEKNFGK